MGIRPPPRGRSRPRGREKSVPDLDVSRSGRSNEGTDTLTSHHDQTRPEEFAINSGHYRGQPSPGVGSLRSGRGGWFHRAGALEPARAQPRQSDPGGVPPGGAAQVAGRAPSGERRPGPGPAVHHPRPPDAASRGDARVPAGAAASRVTAPPDTMCSGSRTLTRPWRTL